jgi:hypothetical protein
MASFTPNLCCGHFSFLLLKNNHAASTITFEVSVILVNFIQVFWRAYVAPPPLNYIAFCQLKTTLLPGNYEKENHQRFTYF